MRIIFKDDILYVDIEGNIGNIEFNIVKSRIFSILDQYEVENIVVNTYNIFNLNRKDMNSFVKEFHMKYNINILVNY